MSIRPDVATIKKGNTSVEMRVEDVQTGEIMIIKPGERIPLDGEVLSGASTIDTKNSNRRICACKCYKR